MFLLEMTCKLKLVILDSPLNLEWERDVKVSVARQIIWLLKLFLITISLQKIRMAMSMVLVWIYGHSVYFFITLSKVKTHFITVAIL